MELDAPVNKFYVVLLFSFLSLVAACGKEDDDVSFFLENYSSGDDDWLVNVGRKRRVDMFFASHRTRPASYYVDAWIIENDPRLVYEIRQSLESRGESIDFDSFINIVSEARERGALTADDLNNLKLIPICARVSAKEAVCAKH